MVGFRRSKRSCRFVHASRAVGREHTLSWSSVSTRALRVRSASIFDLFHLFRSSGSEGALEVPSTIVHRLDLLRKREAMIVQLW